MINLDERNLYKNNASICIEHILLFFMKMENIFSNVTLASAWINVTIVRKIPKAVSQHFSYFLGMN